MVVKNVIFVIPTKPLSICFLLVLLQTLPETDIFLSAMNFPVRPEVDLRITGFPVFWSAHRKKD
jgi:hypothetical protein